MSRIAAFLMVLILAAAGGTWWWIRSTLSELDARDKPRREELGRPESSTASGRGLWHFKYHADVAELEATRQFIHKEPSATPKIIASVERTVAMGKETRWRFAAKQQLQEILLAFRAYNAAFRRLGPDPSTRPEYFDQNGRLHVSWRVHLLGMLGHRSLQDEFHLDEPWDSPHNAKLLARMPDVYRAVDEPDDCAMTRYVVLDGHGSLFEGGRFHSLDDVSDPISETMMLAMLPKEREIPWTRPEDVVVDPAEPLKSFQPLGENGFYFMTVEGALLRFRPDATPAQFLALLSYRGGEPEGTLQEMFNTGDRAERARKESPPE